MDINLKNNSWNKWWTRWALLLLIAILVVSLYPKIMQRAAQNESRRNASSISELKDEFITALLKTNYVLPLELKGKVAGRKIFADTEYLPNYDGAGVYPINNMLENWTMELNEQILNKYGLQYYIVNHSDQNTLTNSIDPLNLIIDGQTLNNKFKFYGVISFDSDGKMDVPIWHGMDKNIKENKRVKEQLMVMELNRTLLKQTVDNMTSYQSKDILNVFQPPRDYTIVYVSENQDFYMGYNQLNKVSESSFAEAGYDLAFFIAIVLSALLAIVLPNRKAWNTKHNVIARIPFELWILVLILNTSLYLLVLEWSNTVMLGNWITFRMGISLLGIAIVLFMILAIWHIALLSIMQMFDLGFRKYMRDSILCSMIVIRVKKRLNIKQRVLKWWGRLKQFVISIGEIDLSDHKNKALMKLLLSLYGVILIACLSITIVMQAFTIHPINKQVIKVMIINFGLVIPLCLIGIFLLLTKRLNQIKHDYTTLLTATQQMADKNLEISIDEDLGMFNPLKVELEKIKYGFKAAVAEEVKSQKMKSELITNVSHDLKTPVTAIITYVNLLLENQATEVEKQKYVEVLNQKSLRLKQLIDDLLELSRTSDPNMKLNLAHINIVEVMKQVEVELSKEITESRVKFRFHVPKHKVMLHLDSEKTFRIFENLYTNIIKYAVPESRAYIEVVDHDQEVKVIIKNVSVSELEFTAEDAVERFIRGDKARNSEGSGLGLAIAKNLVEMQGGRFGIFIDGDLFKVVMIWSYKEELASLH